MNAFDEFIMSDAFFPVLVFLLILLVVVFILIILNNRKKFGPIKKTKNQNLNAINKSEEVHVVGEPLTEVETITTDEFENLLLDDEKNKIEDIPVEEDKNEENIIKVEENPISTQEQNDIDIPKFINENVEINDNNDENVTEEKENAFDLGINDFPDFSSIEDATKKEEHENSQIEDDIMQAANKYIESIMSKNK